MDLRNWGNPEWLYGLWILPAVAALLIYAHRKRAAAAKRFVDPEMVQRLMPPLQGPRPWVKAVLLLLGLTLLIVAAARPRFGVYFEKVSQRGVDLFVALDVSRSMNAEDVAPSRLERAKLDIRDLVERLVGDRIGLIVFAGKPVVKVPLTTDHGFFRVVLDEVDTSSAPRGGTLIGDAIRKAMEAMPQERDRDQVIVLITDGEDHDSYPKEAGEQAGAAGIKIFTVSLGTSREGARIPIRDEQRGLRYLRHEGQEVWSRVDERLLKEIALDTGGAYIPGGTADDLGQIYEDHLAGLAQGEIQAEKRKRYKEQFQFFVCFGVALLLIEMAIPGYRRPEKQPVSAAGTQAGAKAAVVLLGVVGFPSAARAGSTDVAESVSRGIQFYRAGDYKTAISAFRDADVAEPDDPWITYDLATAYAAQGDVDKAEELLREAAMARDQGVAVRSRYNLGNLAASKARTVFGEKPEEASPEVRDEGLALLADAVGRYRDCIELDDSHADARHNLEVIRLWIKHMQALWDERDRQKQREEMNLVEFLALLEARQRELRGRSKALVDEPDSPRRRQAIDTAATAQSKLREEIEPLKDKIVESLQPPAQQGAPGPAQPASDDDLQKAVDILTDLADKAGDGMAAAAGALGDGAVDEATGDQTEAVENLDQIFMGVVPFPALVQRAIETERELIDQVTPIVEKPDEEGAADGTELDLAEAGWNQDIVAGWARVLGPKAEQSLKQLEAMGEAALSGPAGQGQVQQTTDPEAVKKQLEGLRQSMQKAIELGPKVGELAGEAADHLKDEKAADALPKQEEALELLKEIADPLPEPEQKQGDQQQDQDQQQQKDQQDQKDQSGQDQQQQKQRQQELSRQQAEAVLRKVRERQRDRRDLQKQLQQYMGPPGEVEKDW
jgi:Ca-activated chloride channel family protein